jgi:hypothetical protein
MGILESVPEGGKITYETTANGMAVFRLNQLARGAELEKIY